MKLRGKAVKRVHPLLSLTLLVGVLLVLFLIVRVTSPTVLALTGLLGVASWVVILAAGAWFGNRISRR